MPTRNQPGVSRFSKLVFLCLLLILAGIGYHEFTERQAARSSAARSETAAAAGKNPATTPAASSPAPTLAAASTPAAPAPLAPNTPAAALAPQGNNPLPPISTPYEPEPEIDLSTHYVLINGRRAHPYKILAKYKTAQPDSAQHQLLTANDLRIQTSFPLDPALVVIRPNNPVLTPVASPAEAEARGKILLARIKELSLSGQFAYVEPDYIVTTDATPTDTAFTDGRLWGLRNTGQDGGLSGADIDAVNAWDKTTGSTNIIVAVIDTGIRYTHQELATQMWVNSGEIAGNNIDDDRDGYIDNIYGINATTNSGNPMDDNGHGSHCAGTIGAKANGGGPHVGVAWNVKLMACKFLSADGRGSTSDAIKCINFAVAKGAHILSNSWGGGSSSQALSDAIAAANAAEVLFVAAAGNESNNNDLTPSYPASYPHANIVSVAALDRQDQLAGFSNYGLTTVDLGAPGVSIYSCSQVSDTSYMTISGTSMACPHVSGVAALILAQNPDLTPAEVRQRLITHSVPVPSLSGKTVSGGRLNAFNCLNLAPDGILELALSPAEGTQYEANATATALLRVRDFSDVTNATITASAGATAITFRNDGVAPDTTANDNTYSATLTMPASGSTYVLNVEVSAPGKTTANLTRTLRLIARPDNDNFANRSTLTGNTFTTIGNNSLATKETGEPNHANSTGGHSVWYSWTATANGNITLTTTGSTFDTTLAVYSGTAVNSLTSLAYNDDYSGTTSRVSLDVVSGNTYQIALDGYGNSSGNFSLNGTFDPGPPPPANDNFANATALTQNNITGSNVGASKETGEPAHAGNTGGRSVWYTWTAPSGGNVTLTTDGSTFDTLLAVYTGSAVNALSLIASDNDSGQGTNSSLNFAAVSGTTYRIAVDGLNAAPGNINLSLFLETNTPAPANDNFANRSTLTGSSATVTTNNLGATQELGEPAHAGNTGGRSIWYTWTASTAGTLTLSTNGSNFDTLLAVYTGSSLGTLIPVASNDQDPTTGGLTSRVALSVTAGTTYQIAIDGTNNGLSVAIGTVILNLSYSNIVLPPNDHFADRTFVTTATATLTGNNAGATAEAGEPAHSTNSAATKSVWYSWTAPTTGNVLIRTTNQSFTPTVAVYTGTTLGGLTRVPNLISAGYYGSHAFAATAGTTYQIAVDSLYAYSSGSFTLEINAPLNLPIRSYQPPATLTRYIGDTTYFNAYYSSDLPLTYQWKKDGVNLTNSTRLSGATSSNLSIYSLLSSDAGSYTLSVSNLAGTVTTTPCVLTVLTPTAPTIVTQPVNRTLYVGDSINLYINANSNGTTTYQWQKSTDNGTTYTNLTGATYSDYYRYNIQLTDAGLYRCIVTNAGGSTTSNAATVTINATPIPSFTAHPQNLTPYPGEYVGFSVTLAYASSDTTYLWQKSTDNGATYTTVSGPYTYNSTYYISTANSTHVGLYRCIATNASGSATSNTASLTLATPPPPVISFHPTSQAVYIGEGFSVSLSVNQTGTTTYQWQKSTDNGTTYTNLSNATYSSFYVYDFSSTDVGLYRCVATNAGGSTTSNPATITALIPPAPTFSSHPQNVTVIGGYSAYFYTLVSGRGRITYQWQKDGVNLPANPRLYGRDYYYLNVTDTRLSDAGQYRLVATNAGGSTTSNPATLTVTPPPPPVITSHPTPRNATTGSTASFSVYATGGGLSYQWQKDGANLTDSTDGRISGANTSTLSLRTITGDAGLYRCVVSNDGGSVTSNTASLTLTLPPPPTIDSHPTGGTYLEGTPFALYVYSYYGSNHTYQWYKDGTAIPGATNYYYGKTAALSDAGTYHVVLSNAGGSATSSSAVITITPATAPAFILTPSSTAAEVGDLVTFRATATGRPAPTYQWFKNNTAIPGAASSTYTFNPTANDHNATYKLTATNLKGSSETPALTLTVYAYGSGKVLGLFPATRTVGPARVTYPLQVTAKAEWSLPALPDWVSLSATSGGGGKTIAITVAPNPLPTERTATLTIDGLTHTLTQKAAGTPVAELYTVGNNDHGQLGLADPSTNYYPTRGETDIKAIAAGAASSYFIKTDNTLWAVGSNGAGQLGTGNTIDKELPVQIATNVSSLAAYSNHLLFIKTDGTLWATGANYGGQLGTGNTASVNTPTQIATNVKAVATSYENTYFIKTDDTLWATGRNSYGQLGTGNTVSVNTPTQIATNVKAVATGNYYLLYVKNDGTLWAVGYNLRGQLADGTTTHRATLIQIPGTFKAVFASDSYSFFIDSADTLSASGYNIFGQLGLPISLYQTPRAQVTTNVAAVATGRYHTLILKTDGTLLTTGDNLDGQLANGSTSARSTPLAITTNVSAIAAAENSSYFLKTDSTLWAAGANASSQLGRSTPRLPYHTTPLSIASNAATLSLGFDYTTYTLTDKTAWTIGYNSFGQLADGSNLDRSIPAQILTGVQTLVASDAHTLALTENGILYGAGSGDSGRLSSNSALSNPSPITIATDIASIAAGEAHTLYLKTDGTAWAVGNNFYGQLGVGSVGSSTYTPLQIPGTYAKLIAGRNHSFFLKADGTAHAVGNNYYGQLGLGHSSSVFTPTALTGTYTALVGGQYHSHFLRTDGTLWTAGQNVFGQLGDGSYTSRTTPVQILTGVQALASNQHHSFFLKTDNTLWASGFSPYGEIGLSSVSLTNTPTRVAKNIRAVSAGLTHSAFIASGDIGPNAPAAPTLTTVNPTRPASGATVTINGTGFTSPIGVYFNDTPATNVTVVSATQLTAVSPAAYTDALRVTIGTFDGTASLDVAATTTPPPPPPPTSGGGGGGGGGGAPSTAYLSLLALLAGLRVWRGKK